MQALAFVERHGIVLESARHRSIPSLADAIAEEPIRGSWWSHPRSRSIFAITRAVRAAPQILVCRIVDGKISYVHERLWAALARLADGLPVRHLARVREMHSARGTHHVEETPFPLWLPEKTAKAAQRLSVSAARAALVPLLPELRGET